MDKIKATYEKMEDVPEKYAELFEERQGKAILVNIEGIDTDGNVHRLTGANTKLRTENTDLKKKTEAYGGVTPEQVTGMQEKVTELEAQVEAAGRPDEEKVNNLVEAKIKTKLGPVERELKTAKDEIVKQTDRADKLDGSLRKHKVDLAVRTAATNAKVVPSAIEDVLALAGGIFEVAEVDGKEKIITRDGVGITPGLDTDAYFVEVGPNKPHWFPGSNGAGAGGGGRGSTFGGVNPWSEKSWNLTEQGRVIREKGQPQAKQMAESVGSYIGATAPKKGK